VYYARDPWLCVVSLPSRDVPDLYSAYHAPFGMFLDAKVDKKAESLELSAIFFIP
jgi:hypothetical protein